MAITNKTRILFVVCSDLSLDTYQHRSYFDIKHLLLYVVVCLTCSVLHFIFFQAFLMSLNTSNGFTSSAPAYQSMGWNSRTHCTNLYLYPDIVLSNRYNANQTVQGPNQGPR